MEMLVYERCTRFGVCVGGIQLKEQAESSIYLLLL